MPDLPMLVQRRRRGEEDISDQAYLILSPAKRLGMTWQLALNGIRWS